jgi:hypothetical protein
MFGHFRLDTLSEPTMTMTMASPPRPAHLWLVSAVVAIAVFAACWTASVWHWRSSDSAPSAIAIGQLLFGLPLAILLAIWLGRKALLARSGAASNQAAPLPAAAAATATAKAGQRAPLPRIAAGAVRLRGGESAGELAANLRSNGAPCELDGELTDDAGYPILTGRIEHADPASAREVMTQWLAQRGTTRPDFSEEQWRALSLGGAVVAELTQNALMHPLLPDYLATAASERAGSALPMLHVKPVLPAAWSAQQRQAAADWFLHLVGKQGWPAQRLRMAPDFDSDARASVALLDALAIAEAPGLTLLVACESHIGETSVRAWSEQGLLLTGRTPRGQVPGEGAAGLLLADDAQAAQLPGESIAALHGATDGRRPGSADAPGNINIELLSGLARHAIAESGIDAAAITAICTDADLRPNRVGELMGTASAELPQLDLATQMMSVGACCGSAGAVGPVAALALAHHEALESGGQVLCLSNSDSHYRCALIVRAENAP